MIFANKNTIALADIVTSSNNTDAEKIKLINKEYETLWRTSGQTSGTRTITITIPDSAKIANNTIIIAQNINWSDFTIAYDATTIATVTSYAGSDYYLYNEAIASCTTITITITATRTVAEAQCGELIITKRLFEHNQAGELIYKPKMNAKIHQLSDGSFMKNYLNSTIDYEIKLLAVNTTVRDSYITLYELNKTEYFFFIPRPKTDYTWDGQAAHYNWINPFDFFNYNQNIRDNGWDAELEFKQSGVGL